ncbi:MAG: rod shape-determining protein MreC [Bryobacteraceae bacterium]
MESFVNRYRNITVLLLVIFAQLLLLAVQVKNDQDVHLIRVWTVTAVTPMARILEGFRGGSIGFIRNYITLHDADADNRRLQADVDRLKMENIFLKNELNSADRAKALQLFQAHTPSRMLAATVIFTGAGSNSKVVYVDRGSVEGVMRGMAVVTPDGIVGKVIAAYPLASEVLLVTDPDFAAGVVSQKSQVRGTFKGQGTPLGKVDYVPAEEKVAEGEWFYTSGDDRVFPRGFPVGQARIVRPSLPFQEILVDPSGLQRGLEDVLIVVSGAHQDIPDTPPVNQPVYIAPPPPAPVAGSTGAPPDASGIPMAPGGTEADKLRQQYKAAGEAQNHKFGEGEPGSKPPDFTKLGQPAPPSAAPANGAPATPPSADPSTVPAAGGRVTAGGLSGPAPTNSPPAPAKRPRDGEQKPPAEAPPSANPSAVGAAGNRAPAGGMSGPAPTNTPTVPAKRPPDGGKNPPSDPPTAANPSTVPAAGNRAPAGGLSAPAPTNSPTVPAKRPPDGGKNPPSDPPTAANPSTVPAAGNRAPAGGMSGPAPTNTPTVPARRPRDGEKKPPDEAPSTPPVPQPAGKGPVHE